MSRPTPPGSQGSEQKEETRETEEKNKPPPPPQAASRSSLPRLTRPSAGPWSTRLSGRSTTSPGRYSRSRLGPAPTPTSVPSRTKIFDRPPTRTTRPSPDNRPAADIFGARHAPAVVRRPGSACPLPTPSPQARPCVRALVISPCLGLGVNRLTPVLFHTPNVTVEERGSTWPPLARGAARRSTLPSSSACAAGLRAASRGQRRPALRPGPAALRCSPRGGDGGVVCAQSDRGGGPLSAATIRKPFWRFSPVRTCVKQPAPRAPGSCAFSGACPSPPRASLCPLPPPTPPRTRRRCSSWWRR